MKRLPFLAVPATAVAAGIPVAVAPGTTVAQVAYSVAFCWFAVLAWAGVRAQRGPLRTAYALVAAAQSVWVGGDLLYWLLTSIGGVGEVSPSDFLWVLGYPLLAAGLFRMVRLQAPGQLREAVLDGLAMATAVAILLWQLLILPEVTGRDFSPGDLFAVFYPLGDVLMFAAGALLVLSPGSRSGPMRYLAFAVALTFAGDVANSLSAQWWPGFDNERIDAVLLAANGMIATVLWHPDGRKPAEVRPACRERLHPARMLFLGAAMLTLPALVGLQTSGSLPARLVLMTAMSVLTVLVLIRFALVVRGQERARYALAEQASHDALTGLVNRQELHARLGAALESDRRGPTVRFLDLNGFKAVNDRYGHAAGDAVLIEIGRRLLAEVRATDTVARLGGDEFVVMSVGPEPDAGMSDRLRRAVAGPVRFDGHELTVGVAIGTAVAAGFDQPTSDTLLAAADADMYDEKARPVRRWSPRPRSAAG